MIIVVANSKGGVGKSTLAVHLAAWLHQQGHTVTLADCDTQQSSSEWIREAAPGVKAVRLDNPDIILNELPTLGQEADFVVACVAAWAGEVRLIDNLVLKGAPG